MTERKTTLKIVCNDDVNEEKREEVKYLIEKKDDNVYFNDKMVCVKKLEELTKRELEIFNFAKENGYSDEYAILKASLIYFFNDEDNEHDDEKYPYLCDDAAMSELTDEIIIRVFSDKHLHNEYTVMTDKSLVFASGKYCKFPTCGQQFIKMDFNKLFDVFE